MPNLKVNIVANYAGSIWAAIMGVVFVPLYIKFMGVESYGLVGFSGTLIAMFSILDMGLGATLSREMARRSVLVGQEQASRDLLRTVEVIYWTVAIFIGAAVIALSYPVARYWVNPEQLSVSDVQQALMIMGLVTVLRWPFGMYQGGLMGLQKQVLVNSLTAISGTFRGFGAVLVLWLVSPTIQAFFCWQIIVSGLETLATAYLLWHSLPGSPRRPKFSKSLVGEIWQFAGGMMGINVVVLVLSQSDKMILSKMLSLEMYGYYMLAWTLASSIYKVISPISAALFPRFAQLVAARNSEGLVALYHRSCQFMSVMVLPIACVLAVYSYQILTLWTGAPKIAEQTYLVASILIVGTACNAMMNIPYEVQLAYGWTSLAFWVNVVSIIVFIPLLIILTHLYGMFGGAMVWAALNLGYVFIGIRIMHRRILKGELWRWYLYDLGVPFVVALAPVLIGKLFFDEPSTKTWTIILVALTACLSFMSAALWADEIRRSIFGLLAGTSARLNEKYVRIFD
jgi:O-antigen/teichoic acid export membrane protein